MGSAFFPKDNMSSTTTEYKNSWRSLTYYDLIGVSKNDFDHTTTINHPNNLKTASFKTTDLKKKVEFLKKNTKTCMHPRFDKALRILSNPVYRNVYDSKLEKNNNEHPRNFKIF